MRTSAGHWLEMAVRVYDYRRDQLSAAELGELTQKTEGLRRQLREGDDASKLKLGIEALEDVLRRTGGAIYPKSSLVENVEFFLVAAIVILGIRTYFVQPFKIPTNSMWPSYNGMTGEVFKSTAEEPGYVAQGFRFLAQLATPQRIDAPAEGEVMIMFDSYRRGAAFRDVPGRKWLVLPTLLREYQLVIGGANVPVRVPADFDLDRVLLNAYFDGAESYPASRSPNGGRVGLLRTGKFVQSGGTRAGLRHPDGRPALRGSLQLSFCAATGRAGVRLPHRSAHGVARHDARVLDGSVLHQTPRR